MKKILCYIILVMISCSFFQNIIAQTNIWIQKNATGHTQTMGDLTTGRRGGICFTIGNKAYVGLGINFFTMSYQKDFWEYDPTNNTWTRKADFPYIRQDAIAFSIGNKGYVGIGQGQPGILYNNDFWEYDPSNDKWTQKADYRGGLISKAFAFSIGNKGYVGTGEDGSFKRDFWEYDPSNNTWTQKADFGGGIRVNAVGFSLNNKGYAGTGLGQFYTYSKDFWEYDPAINTWTQKADFGGVERSGAVGFNINGKGYIGTGSRLESNIFTHKKDFWQYEPLTNIWTRKADLAGTARLLALGFSVNGKGYISSGQDVNGVDQNDLWEYTIDNPISTFPPTVTSVNPNSACAGSTIIITGTNFIGATSVSIGSIPVTSFTVNSSTTITAIVGQSVSGDLSVTTPSGIGIFRGFTFIYTNTSIKFNPDTILLMNSTSTILNPIITGTITGFLWSPSNLLINPLLLTPQTLLIKNTTSFTLSLITPEGCTISDHVILLINNELYMPNAFTPNGDGLNDYYRIPQSSQLSLAYLTIYDKWGNTVFSTTDITKSWDGKNKNVDCNAGGYVYVLKGVYRKMEILLRGSFVLIR